MSYIINIWILILNFYRTPALPFNPRLIATARLIIHYPLDRPLNNVYRSAESNVQNNLSPACQRSNSIPVNEGLIIGA